ncbi:two-component system regulatory protein YycI [Robertmurraya korlensis]|uniref:two-component system regulatory protein YycI n=1 Tax=Robertmurraya korlensis TaxID=519977 RepID=UPI000826C517|nr:two-component system regulatory protein YycI [Robertmurraya korlensis]
MDWSRIKTIFILSFFVLNIYLMNEFLKIRTATKYEYATNPTLENRLKADEITYNELPKNFEKDKYLSTVPRVFIEEEVAKLLDTTLSGQTIIIRNNQTIDSKLGTPLKVSSKGQPSELDAFLKGSVINGDQYRYWGRDDNENSIIYYQQYEEKLFYKNLSGQIKFYLNSDNEVVSYEQTLLDKIEELTEDERIIQPIKALETLYENGHLPYGTKIEKVEFGYYTHVRLTSSQVLTPAWRFVLDEGENLFVNAFEGQVIQLKDEENNWSE